MPIIELAQLGNVDLGDKSSIVIRRIEYYQHADKKITLALDYKKFDVKLTQVSSESIKDKIGNSKIIVVKSYKIGSKTYHVLYTVSKKPVLDFTSKPYIGKMSGISFADNTTDFIEFFPGLKGQNDDIKMPWSNEKIDFDIAESGWIFYEQVQGSQNRNAIMPGNKTAIYDAAGLCMKVLRSIFKIGKNEIHVVIKYSINPVKAFNIYIPDVDDNIGNGFNSLIKTSVASLILEQNDNNEGVRRNYQSELNAQNDNDQQIDELYGGKRKLSRKQKRKAYSSTKKRKGRNQGVVRKTIT